MRKSRSRGFVVSLSGGCDSASVVVLVATMLKFAEPELGFENQLLKDWAVGFETKRSRTPLNCLAGY